MVVGQHSVIRSAEPDDASALKRVYDSGVIRCSLLDQRRELTMPTLDELREAMATQEMGRGVFHAVEDLDGRVRGFCSVRGANLETRFAEAVAMLIDVEDYRLPLAGEVFAFLAGQAFERLGLNKLVAHCLDSETECRAWLVSHGFSCDGLQREALYASGRWHSVEAYSLFRSASSFAQPATTAGLS